MTRAVKAGTGLGDCCASGDCQVTSTQSVRNESQRMATKILLDFPDQSIVIPGTSSDAAGLLGLARKHARTGAKKITETPVHMRDMIWSVSWSSSESGHANRS